MLKCELEDDKEELVVVNYCSNVDEFPFDNHPLNRDVTQAHLNKIIRDIEKNGFRKDRPILVNTKIGYVVDGQHRLKACSILGCPFYWKESEMDSPAPEDPGANPWNNANFVKYWSATGKPEYVRYKRLTDEFQVSDAFIVSHLLGKSKKLVSEGNLYFEDGDNVTLAAFRELTSFADRAWGKIYTKRPSYLSIALARLARWHSRYQINIEHLCRKLTFDSIKAKYDKHYSTSQWMQVLEDIYNYREKSDQLEFARKLTRMYS